MVPVGNEVSNNNLWFSNFHKQKERCWPWHSSTTDLPSTSLLCTRGISHSTLPALFSSKIIHKVHDGLERRTKLNKNKNLSRKRQWKPEWICSFQNYHQWEMKRTWAALTCMNRGLGGHNWWTYLSSKFNVSKSNFTILNCILENQAKPKT